MSEERGPDELSAEEIADRIGANHVWAPVISQPRPRPAPASEADAYHARLVAVRQAMSLSTVQPAEPAPATRVAIPPPVAEPRMRLVRDAAAALLGFSAIALILVAVWPPSPSGGVLGATATPAAPTATASSTPEPTPTPDPTESFAP